MKKIEFMTRIVNSLLSDSYLRNFKFRKRDTTLVKQTNFGFESIELQICDSFDLETNVCSFKVIPLYLKRFDVLNQWFEKFSFKSTRDQRDGYNIGFTGEMLGKKNEFHFLDNGVNYDYDIHVLITDLTQNASSVFGKFISLEDYYEYYIAGAFRGADEFPIVGADWIFEYLTAVKIVRNDLLEDFINVIKTHVKKMFENNEPNVAQYYMQLDDIIEYLCSLKCSVKNGKTVLFN